MDDELGRQLIKAALERYKEKTGQTWLKIADDLKINEVTIYRWRDGEVGHAARVLVQLVAEACNTNAP